MRLLLLLLLLVCTSFAQTLSNIKPAKTYYLNTSIEGCDKHCLREHLELGEYLSFLARYEPSLSEHVNEYESIYQSLYQDIIPDFLLHKAKEEVEPLPGPGFGLSAGVALIIPEKTLKSHALNIINSALAYITSLEGDVNFRVFLIGSEDNEERLKAAIKEAGSYELVLAAVSKESSLRELASSDAKAIFLPTLNIKDAPFTHEKLFFAGLDYEAQIEKLAIYLSQIDPIDSAAIVDNSKLSQNLGRLSQKALPNTTLINTGSEFSTKMLGANQRLRGSGLFMHTPLVKTALFASQIRALHLSPSVFLSTQINYHPDFLSIVQDADRRLFVIAASSKKPNSKLSYQALLLEQEPQYSWLSYVSMLGLDYFLSKDARSFSEEFLGNQLKFQHQLFKSFEQGFALVEEGQ